MYIYIYKRLYGGFLKCGYPWIIHLIFGFSIINHLFWGTMTLESPWQNVTMASPVGSPTCRSAWATSACSRAKALPRKLLKRRSSNPSGSLDLGGFGISHVELLFRELPGIKHGKPILVGGIPTPLKNMSSSVGMMTFPIYGKIKNVPNHQPLYNFILMGGFGISHDLFRDFNGSSMGFHGIGYYHVLPMVHSMEVCS